MAEVDQPSRLEQTLKLRNRISVQLGLALSFAVLLTLAASLVGLVYLEQINKAQKRVYEVSMPDMEAAFAFSIKSGEIVAAASLLTSAVNEEELESVREEVEADKKEFQEQLASLGDRGLDTLLIGEILRLGETMLANIDTVSSLATRNFELAAELDGLQAEFSLLETEILNLLNTAVDQQLFYFVTGYQTRDQEPAERDEHFKLEEFDLYRHLVDLRRFATVSAQLLSNALTLQDAPLMETFKDRFETNEYGIERVLGRILDDDLYATLNPMFSRLTEIGLEQDGIFATKSALFNLDDSKDSLYLQNQQLGARLVVDIEELVRTAQSDTALAAQSSANAVATGRLLLIIVSVASVLGATLVSVFYIGNRILRRLDLMSERMRSMAGGDLEAEVVVEGKDEIAQMAQALEIFRRHALEVQRLNLVELLAEELREKNDALESANEELVRAQDQILMREKLVALGELTAGVAHEIRNPLNFIMNFSEISEELLEELIDEVIHPDKRVNPGGEMDAELVEENSEDLVSNLARIREHGARANRIIDDMLKMGRGTQEFAETDLNGLLDQNAKLAFHSARAADSDFQLDMQFELDESLGQVKVVPQDLGRVFINIVTNAGYAVNEKFNALKEENPSTDFIPTLTCTTQRKEDQIIIAFRDNGTGMPQSVIERIFNPFFTTKPTDKGTGLGLSMSNDIVREHGGTINVTSEEGEWTLMEIQLPLDPSEFMSTAEDSAEQPDEQED